MKFCVQETKIWVGENVDCINVITLSSLSCVRRGHDVLKDQLPSKEEHVILVRLSPLQRALYTEFMSRFKEAGNSGWLSLNPLKAFCVCCKVRNEKAVCVCVSACVHMCKCVQRITFWPFVTRDARLQIWNHPDVLYEALQKENLASEQDLDLDDITTTSNSTTNTSTTATGATRSSGVPSQKPKPLEAPPPLGGLSLNQLQERANQVITYEWVCRRTTHFTVLFNISSKRVKQRLKPIV